MDKKTKLLVSSYIGMRMEEGKSTEDIVNDFNQCGISKQDLVNSGLLVSRSLTPSDSSSVQISVNAMRMIAARYVAACTQAGDGQRDIADAFARMGFTRNELGCFGLSMFCLESSYFEEDSLDCFDEADEQQGSVSTVDVTHMRGMPQPFAFEDYTLEECQFCETEVVIRSTGVSVCPKCKRPILPCTKCSSCTSPCPYDHTGRFGLRLRPTNPPITKEETEFYLKELERRKRQ